MDYRTFKLFAISFHFYYALILVFTQREMKLHLLSDDKISFLKILIRNYRFTKAKESNQIEQEQRKDI